MKRKEIVEIDLGGENLSEQEFDDDFSDDVSDESSDDLSDSPAQTAPKKQTKQTKSKGRKELLLKSGLELEPVTSSGVVKNRQRILLLSSRGIVHRFRHLLNDLHLLMPHSKKESKLDQKHKLEVINELSELSNCNNALYFEVRKHQDLYLWLAKTPVI